jgi:hypothetical protein
MSAEEQIMPPPDTPTLTIDVNPPEVDAGSRMTLTGTVTGAPGYDLRGQMLMIRDRDGRPLDEVAFTEFDGEISRTSDLELTAPVEPGEHVWIAIMTEATGVEAPREVAQVPFSFPVKAHTTSVVVWDVPSAIEVGSRFRIKAGVKCSAGCTMTGETLTVHDGDGNRLASATLGDRPWPGTAALHYAELELTAPSAEGRQRWQVRADAGGQDLPHSEGAAGFGLNCTPVAECTLTVQAVDVGKDTPIPRARIQMHPYRGVTDENGMLTLRVPKGSFKLVVSGKDYVSKSMDIEVTQDTATKVGLIHEPTDDEKLWVWA